MKIVGQIAWANEEAADLGQTAEDCHRKKKKRLPSGTSFHANEVRLLRGKEAYQLHLYFRLPERQDPDVISAKGYVIVSF